MGCLSGMGRISVSSGISLWAGIGSLGFLGSHTGRVGVSGVSGASLLEGWGLSGVSLSWAAVSGNSAVAVWGAMGVSGTFGLSLWDGQDFCVLWDLSLGRNRVSGISGVSHWPGLGSLGFLGPPFWKAGVSRVSGVLSGPGWGLWDPRDLSQAQAGVSGVSLFGPSWGLWDPWGSYPGQDGVSGTPGVSIRVRMGSLGPLGCLFGPGRGLCVSLSRPCLGL